MEYNFCPLLSQIITDIKLLFTKMIQVWRITVKLPFTSFKREQKKTSIDIRG